jgi:hypothetical protein
LTYLTNTSVKGANSVQLEGTASPSKCTLDIFSPVALADKNIENTALHVSGFITLPCAPETDQGSLGLQKKMGPFIELSFTINLSLPWYATVSTVPLHTKVPANKLVENSNIQAPNNFFT